MRMWRFPHLLRQGVLLPFPVVGILLAVGFAVGPAGLSAGRCCAEAWPQRS
jgi:hypothetical protein